jgi:hypothetical protein
VPEPSGCPCGNGPLTIAANEPESYLILAMKVSPKVLP